MSTRCNRGFYCRSYYLLNMFRASLCPPSGAQEYYTVVATCGISCCGFQVAGLVWSWGLCVWFAGCCSILQTRHITNCARTHKTAWWHCGGHSLNCECSNHSGGMRLRSVRIIAAIFYRVHSHTISLSPHSVRRCWFVSFLSQCQHQSVELV